MASVADVRLRDIAGTFAGLTDPQIQAFLDDTEHRLGESPGRWGECYDLAQVYLTLHLLSSAMYGATGGKMTWASAGGISVGFGGAGSGAVSTGYGSTRWGQLFEELALACGLTGPMVIVGLDLPTC